MLTTSNLLPPFSNIDLGGSPGYLRVISPHQRKPLARKILLADDSVTAQNMGRKILADAGYEVLTVNNGSAALKKIAEAKPDLIVLDVYMPGYSGLEVCQRLKEASETARIPILLTVGKLEPFKPEEAKRVRADGFIVKPFEASELLSALSKLEDKIVPGRETHKPGRFARANAALESYDKTVAIEEDSSWKNRIAFPTKKKKSVAEDGDDPAIYNAVNKDLRTVVERKPSAKLQELSVEPEKVNLEALAPEGLPKDVTPEEIAALAAAAAHMKSSAGESKAEEPSHPVVPVETNADARAAESRAPETKIEASVEHKPAQALAEASKLAEEPMATIAAEETGEGESKETSAPPDNPVPDAANVPAPNPAEVMAALSTLEQEKAGPGSASSGDNATPREAVEEPITMAVAAGAEYSTATSRWTAVPVALAPDEIAVSLEHEMQKAYAAFAAAEMAHSAPVSAVTQSEAVTSEPAPPSETSSAAETRAHEPAVPSSAPSEITQATSAVAEVSTDAIAAAVKELEAVAASYEAQRKAEPALTVSATPVSGEAPEIAEVLREEPHPVQAETSQPEPAKEIAAKIVHEEPRQEASAPVAETEAQVAEPTAQVAAEESEAAAHENRVSEDQAVNQVQSQEAEPVASGQSAAGGRGDMGKKETEIAQTTAAAWASWRRVREDGKSQLSDAGTGHDEPRDAAAMAVAAGAESSPEDTAADADSGEIASIVDSVLADLRPKIVEEISRKLGKKK